MFIRIFFSSACAFIAGIINPVNAGFVMHFAEDPSVNHFEAAVNSNVSVGVYVSQNAGSSDLTNFGLITMGFGVRYDPSKIQLVAPFSFSANFPRSQDAVNNNGVLQVYGESLFNNAGANPGPVPVKADTILLGTLTLRTLVPGNFSVAVGDYDPALPNFADFGLGGAGAATNFDKLLFGNDVQGNYQFTAGQITAVPEPSTLILVGLAASSMGAAAWRKRKQLLTRKHLNG